MSALFAIAPVFLIIIIGLVCRRLVFVEEGFWRGAERLTYFLLFPALLISKMSVADVSQVNFPIASAVIA